MSTTNSRWLDRRAVIVGRTAVPTYTLMLYVGCVAGTWAGAAVAANDGLDATRYALTTIVLTAVALIGARLLYVVDNWSDYRAERMKVFGRSGAAVYGGLLLAIPVSLLALPLVGLPFWKFWDAASVTMLLGLLVTKFGCLANGCCLGRRTESRFGMNVADVHGHRNRRVPAQLLEAAWAAVLLGLFFAASEAAGIPPGTRFAGVVGGYAVGRLVLEHTRELTSRRDRFVNVTVSCLLLVGALAVLATR